MEDLKEDQTLDSSAGAPPPWQDGHQLFAPPSQRARANHHGGEMMGPILRRKKVVSLPLGHGGTPVKESIDCLYDSGNLSFLT